MGTKILLHEVHAAAVIYAYNNASSNLQKCL